MDPFFKVSEHMPITLLPWADYEGPICDPLFKHEGIFALPVPHPQPALAGFRVFIRR
jgi:hypothetical protein